MRVQHSAKVISNIFDVVNSFVDEIQIVFDKEKMHIEAIDDSHIAFISLTLPREFFYEYEVDEEYTLAVSSDALTKALSIKQSNDDVSIIAEKGEDGKLSAVTLEFKNENMKSKRKITIPLIKGAGFEEFDPSGLMSIEYKNSFKMPIDLLISSIRAAEQFSDSLTFIIEQNGNNKELILHSSGVSGEINYIIDNDDLYDAAIEEEGKWEYQIVYLKQLLKSKEFVESMTVRLGLEGGGDEEGKGSALPIRIDFDVDGGGELISFIAARVDEEEDDYA